MKRIFLLFTAFLIVFSLGCADIADTNDRESEKSDDKENEKIPVSELYAIPADKITIGFISSSSEDDCYTQLCESALRNAAEDIGVYEQSIRSMYNVSPGYECERVAQILISLGCNVIVSESNDLTASLGNAAKSNPEVYFIAYGNEMYLDNISVYSIDTTALYYLFGAVAATLSDTQRIGYIADLDKEKVADINAFALGALAVSPDLSLDVAFADELDGEYAELILNQFSVGGCDVFARHGDGELLRAYNAELSYAILDLCPCATDGIPLDVTYSIDDIFLSFFNMITTGTWVAASDTLSFFDSGISADMSNEKFEAEDIMFLSNIVAKLSSENFEIFKGEIKNNNGEIEIKDGHIPTQKEIAEMDFFVQGITGTLK